MLRSGAHFLLYQTPSALSSFFLIFPEELSGFRPIPQRLSSKQKPAFSHRRDAQTYHLSGYYECLSSQALLLCLIINPYRCRLSYYTKPTQACQATFGAILEQFCEWTMDDGRWTIVRLCPSRIAEPCSPCHPERSEGSQMLDMPIRGTLSTIPIFHSILSQLLEILRYAQDDRAGLGSNLPQQHSRTIVHRPSSIVHRPSSVVRRPSSVVPLELSLALCCIL